ncbi:MAG: hypothetical protein K0Q94_1285 [Paenibacillus sp.]|uniref:hypothetical protein n=1 Tax=Paenibacillus sp. GCM10012303 TaxID=3317340 RepID=UPI0029F2873E|nr:hypothetical protein [Paenibacillus sp.]
MIAVVQRICLKHGLSGRMLSGIDKFKSKAGYGKWSSIEVLAARSPEEYEEFIVTSRWDLTAEQFDQVCSDWYGAVISELPPSGIVRYECSCCDIWMKRENELSLLDMYASDGNRKEVRL